MDTPEISAQELVAPLAETMPEPTVGHNVASQATPPPPSFATPPPTVKDGRGKTFDPEKHLADAEGKPRFDKQGNFIPAGAGRPRKNPKPTATKPAPTTGPVSFGDPVFAEPEFEEPKGDSAEGTAEGYLQLSYAALVAYFGPDVKPTENEHEALKTVTVQVIKKHNISELQPEVQLAALSAGIFMGKLQKPSVKEKFDSLMEKTKKCFKR